MVIIHTADSVAAGVAACRLISSNVVQPTTLPIIHPLARQFPTVARNKPDEAIFWRIKRAQKHPGRQELPAHLPRIEKMLACTPEQHVCGNCGEENSVIGYEKSEQLEVKPAEYFVVVTKREKRACKACEEQGVECAPAPVRIIKKGLASDRTVIDTVVSKYLPVGHTSPEILGMETWAKPARLKQRDCGSVVLKRHGNLAQYSLKRLCYGISHSNPGT